MRTVQIGTFNLVIGVEWIATQAATQKEAVEEALSTAGVKKKFGILIEGVDSYAVGLSDKPNRSIVGAAWLADSQKDAGDFVLIEELPDSSFWMCAIKNGTPFYGSDMVSDKQTIAEELKIILQSGSYRLLTKNEFFGEEFKNSSSEFAESGFESLIRGKPNKFKIKSLKQTQKQIIALAVMLVLLISGYTIWTEVSERWVKEELFKRQQQETMQKNQAKEAQVQTAKRDFELAKQKAIENANQTIKKLVNEQQAANLPLVWFNELAKLKLNTGGWQYKEGLCSNEECVITLTPSDGATNQSLKNHISDAEISEAGQAQLRRKTTWTHTENNQEDLSNKEEFSLKGISLLQALKGLGFLVSWTKLDPVLVNVEIPQVLRGIQPKNAAQPDTSGIEKIDTGVLHGSFKIDGVQSWSLKEIASRLPEKEFVYERLTVKFDSTNIGTLNSWSIEGSYYVKK